MKIQTLLIFAIVLMPIILLAQKKEVRFGKINKEELQMEYYEQDSSANAVVLYDYGKVFFQRGFIVERHRIIKILKDEGKKYADFGIPMIRFNNFPLRFMSFKATTFNYENGNIVETKLNRSDLIFEKTYEQLTTVKGAFPNVKAGSIIEIKYSYFLYFFSIPDWYFQYDDIPVKYSEFYMSFPAVANLHIEGKGYADINTHYEKIGTPDNTGFQYIWYAENIPAFKKEEYITTTNDFKKKIEVELSSVKGFFDHSSTWKEVDNTMKENEYFGEKINESLFLKNITDTLITKENTGYEKMLKVYSFVQKNLNWTGYKTKYSYKSYREIFKSKRGNSSGEINLSLILMLKYSGIKVEPVILSTRDNGKIFPMYPTIDKFNYVIAKVTIGGKEYYLDATEKLVPAGILPKRCLNGTCRLMKQPAGKLFDMIPVATDKSFLMYILSINDNNISGSVQKTYNDYSALDKRKEIEKIGNTDDYSKHKIKLSTKENITDYKIENFEDIYKSIKESYKISTTDNITFVGDMIYLTPLLNERITENPFKLEERKYPVDYAYPISKKIIMQYTIPEGYEIAEMPKNISMSLPGKAAKFQFYVSTAGNMMQVISNFKINQTVFQYDTYKALQTFYNLVIEKQNEKIVLKKKA